MRIGILTSGGDTPGMNAVIRAALIQSKHLGHILIGFRDGWKGLLENLVFEITDEILDQIELELGGTILGSGRVNPLKDEQGISKIKQVVESNALDCIIAIGGEDTLGVANKLTQVGIPMIGVPKTIDNDLDATDYTFGFNTAITIATEAFDRLKTTAKSHNRIIVVEIMGRHAGWMTLHAGIAGGAHVILIPEYPLNNQQICSIIKKRYDAGHTWALVAISEGFGYSDEITKDNDLDEFGHILLEKQSIGLKIAEMLETRLGYTTRSITLGHTQRGGSPTAYDRVLATQLGLKSVELADQHEFGKMPALRGTQIVPVDLSEAVAKLKTVDQESWDIAKTIMGI
ncbi:MAG: 6-phosphofructokinase [Candidatus Kariarchaeaceae archaeon]|jgi:6-phosphofructokinase 1